MAPVRRSRAALLLLPLLVLLVAGAWYAAGRAGHGEVAEGVATDLPRPAEPPPAPVDPVTAGADERAEVQPPVAADEELPGAPAPAAATSVELSVLVVDEQDRALPGLAVEVTPVGERSAARYVTDAAGGCTISGTRKSVLYAHGAGVGCSDMVVVDFDPALAGELLRVVVRPAPLVRGRVVHADGTGVPFARVVVFQRGSRIGERAPHDPAPVETDAEGRFEVVIHPSGSFGFTARKDDQRSPAVMVDGWGAGLTEIVLEMFGAFSVSGRLLDPAGEPVSDGRVWLWMDRVPYGERPFEGEVTKYTATAADGRFELLLPGTGRYRLLGTGAEGAPTLVNVPVDEDDPHPVLVMELVPPAAITGVVVDGDGEPLAGTSVYGLPDVDDDGADDGPGSTLRFGKARVATDANGRFELTPLHPDAAYRLRLTPAGEDATAPIERRGVPAGTRGLRIVVDDAELEGATLELVLTSGITGGPLESVESQLARRLDSGAWASYGWQPAAAPGGRLLVEHLRAGDTYAVRVRAPEHAPVTHGPFVATVDAAPVQLAVGAPSVLEVTVLEAGGGPFADARVSLRWLGELHLDQAPVPRTTDERGQVRWNGLVVGRWRVTARRPGLAPVSMEVELTAGEVTSAPALVLGG
jgi:uncharacterized GH25 family protein